MGKNIDLHVIPRVEDRRSCEQMAELLKTARYSTIGLTVPTGLLNDHVKSLRLVFEQHGVDTALRADFSPPSRTELLRLLRRFRNHYDIIAIKCVNQRVATVACRDRRVDVVFFDPANRNLRFTHTFARLLRGAVEFNVISDLAPQADSWAFARVRKALAVAREHDNSGVLSSGARNCEMIRSPFQLSALATTLGLPREKAIRGVTSVPESIVAENREKRAPNYVEEGVKIVVQSGR